VWDFYKKIKLEIHQMRVRSKVVLLGQELPTQNVKHSGFE